MRLVKTNMLLKYGSKIDWMKSVGETVEFNYDDITGNIKILDYTPQDEMLLVDFNNRKEPTKCSTNQTTSTASKTNAQYGYGLYFISYNKDTSIIEEYKLVNNMFDNYQSSELFKL